MMQERGLAYVSLLQVNTWVFERKRKIFFSQVIYFLISNFISIFHNHIAINLEDIDKTYANKD